MKKTVAFSLFLFSLSISLLLITGGYCFSKWNAYRSAQEKRMRLDQFYLQELSTAYFFFLNPHPSEDDTQWAVASLEETECRMIDDGYDRAEIDQIRNKAREANCLYWQEAAEYHLSSEQTQKLDLLTLKE